MQRFNVPSCPRVWPRVAVIALVGVGVAGCSNSARFESGVMADNSRPAQTQDTTGSIGSRPAISTRVESQPLPAPIRPVAASGGVANGAQGLGAYRPGRSDITASVPARREPSPAPVGHWTWDGGSPVTVGRGETIESIGRKYGVPASAIMQTNHINSVRPGQRVVIPRYITATATHARPPKPVASLAPRASENVHIVEPGESLMGIARRNGVTLVALARANKIKPYDKINIGDRLAIPGERHVAARRSAPPHLAQPRTVPVDRVASSAPVQTARIVTPEPPPPTTESVTRTAEAAGSMPSFRWPVKGRIITAFGAKSNGAQNDGINLAVPEGTPIKAADDGVVAYAGNELKGYGNLVLIRHANGYVSAYANASELMVKRGDTIKRGQVIAHAGQTGNVTSPQLHFEIRKGSTPVDPTKYLGGA